MAAERFVLLGLAHVRSSWFAEVARWSTTAIVPVEFVKAMSMEEVRVRLRAGRSYSALIVDDTLVGLDRDLVELAHGAGCAVIVVTSGRTSRAWTDLGASAQLPSGFGRTELLQVLSQTSTPIARGVEPAVDDTGSTAPSGFRGRLVTVTGPGGTGASTVAMAVAQGLAADPRYADLVCLADFALDAELAMLHGSHDVVPGVVELVEAHRGGSPGIHGVRGLTWHVPERGYHLLLGLRRHRDWTAVRPRAFDAALDGLRGGYRAVVADIDSDLEGEAASGSLDVEERNTMARSTTAAADLNVVVGDATMKGLHSLLRVVRDLLGHGVPGGRLLPVLNRAPRSAGGRAELTAAFGELLRASALGHGVPSPVHLVDRRHLDLAIRDGVRLPEGWIRPVATAVLAVLDLAPAGHASEVTEPELVAVRPGALGTWTDQVSEERDR